ncbi:hypothetical protein CBR_g51323 [Chara braunii]|uniref:Uncharacterized protein n=1 Tax=Chara braunii TaxID=69332 RepID=A0A388M8A7_CHABU|nr:hypothetical protein CBR_g51323 [Chara braunii]|eukprot:GBG90818.1 hypothetical protein CBR_g51323 [Chara braunii]
MGVTLPAREANLFKSIVKSYETKQYKKGLKAADQILKKFPDHGETLAMKGLTLNCMDRKPEAYDLVRKGLVKDLKSHVCWHVFGLLHRSDREYREAIKCYRNALRSDPDNIQILRDLSLLQIQMRDLGGFVQTRCQLLTLKPNHRNNWIGFAIAQHLNDNRATSVQILEAYEGTLEEDHPPESERYEHSEMLLYKAMLQEESGDFERAIQELDRKQAKIVDTLAWKEQRASLLLGLKRLGEAEAAYRKLLDVNPDNYAYYVGLQRCLGVEEEAEGSYSEGNTAKLMVLYEELREKYPRSAAAKRIPLDFLQGEVFAEALDRYVRPFLRKGVPSLFSDLRPLYNQPGKAEIMERVFTRLETSLRASGRFPKLDSLSSPLPPPAPSAPSSSTSCCTSSPPLPSSSSTSPPSSKAGSRRRRRRRDDDDESDVDAVRASGDHDDEVVEEEEEEEEEDGEIDDDQEPPSTLMWMLFLLAQHHDRRERFDKALEMIDRAIAHTPTVIDLYLIKGRILKHAGDPVAAAALADEARSMDLADRFLNSECVKRMLKADQVEAAETTAALFTKDGDQHNNLFDMQCMWYELASGDSHLRQGNFGKALKKYLAVEKHYQDMEEDQFDFHTYCLRKMTLRAYVKMLRMADRLHSHKFFCRAAAGAVRCYLKVFDKPPSATAEEADAATMQSMTSAERKKARRQKAKGERAKKLEEERAAKEEEAAAAAAAAAASAKGAGGGAKKGGGGASQGAKPVDTDPDGEKLLQVPDLLAEASKYLRLLQDHADSSFETHLLAYEVAVRKRKLLLALRGIKKMRRIQPHNPDGHRCLIGFFHLVDGLPVEDVNPVVMDVVTAERKEMLGAKSLVDCNEAFLDEHSGSLSHRAVVAEMMLLLSPEKKEMALKLVLDSPSGGGNLAGGFDDADVSSRWRLDQCVAVHRLIQDSFKDGEAAARWRERCIAHYPYSLYFSGPKSSKVVGLPVVAGVENVAGGGGVGRGGEGGGGVQKEDSSSPCAAQNNTLTVSSSSTAPGIVATENGSGSTT